MAIWPGSQAVSYSSWLAPADRRERPARESSRHGAPDAGAFVAADAKSGKLLWHFNAGQSWKAGPMTYLVDGVQYIAVAGGSSILAFRLP